MDDKEKATLHFVIGIFATTQILTVCYLAVISETLKHLTS